MRVIEVFGPTVQGEGPFAGQICHFLRLGGCDYRCEWCDTMYAVEPAAVRAAENLTVGEIVARLGALAPAPMLVISGGNPALHRCDALLDQLDHDETYDIVTVETQGSVWREWLNRVSALVISPKPPSSGMATERNWGRFEDFMRRTTGCPRVLKIVVFDTTDLDWARMVTRRYPTVPLCLSAGTDTEADDVRESVSDRYRWLCETVAHEPALHRACLLPQLHVIAWGNRVGV